MHKVVNIGNMWGGVNALDLLRIMATLMVLIVHWGNKVLSADNFFHNYTIYGDRGVPVFFALSGFLIMFSLEATYSMKSFYIKRVFRIVPLYYVMLLVLMLIRPMPEDIYGLGWLRYFLFLNTTLPANSVEWISICGFWCIPSFMIFYLISPFIRRCFGTFWKVIILISISYIIGKIFTKLFIVNDVYQLAIRHWINTLPIFFCGCASYWAIKEHRQKCFLLLAVTCLIVFATINLSNYQLWGVAASAIIVLVYKKQLPSWLKNSNILKWFAKLSFTIFLVHFVILEFLDLLELNKIVYTLLFLFLTLLFAYILNVTVEKYSNRLMKYIISK